MSYRLTFLGCGSSTGVPRVGGGWGNCDPKNPKNRRRRSAVLFEKPVKADGSVSPIPVLVNLFGTVERVAWGMDREPHQLREVGETLAFLRQPQPQTVRAVGAGGEQRCGGQLPRLGRAPLSFTVRLRVQHDLVEHLVHPVVIRAVLVLQRAPRLEAAAAG